MNNMLYENEMRAYIRRKAACYKTHALLASEMKVSPQYLSDIINDRKPISEKTAEFFGFKRVVLFVTPDESAADREKEG